MQKKFRFSDAEFYAQSFEKKIIQKYQMLQKLARPWIFPMWLSFNFFSVFPDFRTLPDHSGKPKPVESKQKKLAVTGEKISRLSQKVKFSEPIEKNTYFII